MASLLTQQIHTWCECLQGVRDSVKCLLRRSYQQPDWSYSGEAGGGGSVLCCNASRPQCPSDNIDRAWLINADENIHPAPTGPVTLNTSALLCRQRAADWASRALDLHRRLAHWGPMLLQIQPWSKHSCLKVFDLQTINDLLLDWDSCKQTSNWFFFFPSAVLRKRLRDTLCFGIKPTASQSLGSSPPLDERHANSLQMNFTLLGLPYLCLGRCV